MGQVIDDMLVERFCQLVVSGKTHTDAYIETHPRTKARGTSLWVMAHNFAHLEKVQSRLAELRKEEAEKWASFRSELLGYLTEEIRECYRDNHTLSPVMKQVEQVSKMLGFDKQTLEVKAVSGALDSESATAKINFLMATISK